MDIRQINWKLFEEYNSLDARKRVEVLGRLGIHTGNEELLGILTKSHFVIPGKTRFECQKCGECCRYARKISQFNYDACPFLTTENTCSKHDNRYMVCKWFPFFVFHHPQLGDMLTIKPYCSGYGKGSVVDYVHVLNDIKNLHDTAKDKDDGAFVIHELIYLPGKKEWVFPSRANVDALMTYVTRINRQTIQQNVFHEGELHYAHHYTSGLLGTFTEPQATISQHGIVTDVNDAFTAICNVPKDNMIGTGFSEWFLNPENIKAKLEWCFLKGKFTGSPQQIRQADGNHKGVLLNAMTYRNRNDGQIHDILVSLNEMTPSIYKEVIHSVEYARNLMEASIDGIVVVDPEGMITDLNDSFCQLAGANRKSILGNRFKSYFEDPEKAERSIQRTYQENKMNGCQLRIQNKTSGKWIPVSFHSSVYKGNDGSVLGIIVIVRDNQA